MGSGMLVGCGQKGPLYLPAQSNDSVEVELETVDAEQGRTAKETKDESPTTD